MNSIKIFLVILFSALVASCGGGGGDSSSSTPTTTPTPTTSLTGVFSDAPVAGLNYYTNTGFGGCTSAAPCTTNSAGQFNYTAGNSVTFSAAGVTLGTATNLSTTASVNSPAVVTPVSLAPSGSTASSAPVVAIGQFLSGLNSVALQSGQGGNGVFTIPTATGTNAATVTILLNSLQNAGVTNLSTTAGLPAALQIALTAASGVVPSAPQVTANITQSVNSVGVLGSIWTGTCTQCNAGAGSNVNLMLNPDGVVRGFVKINSSSSGAGSVIGGWEGYTTTGACSAATSGIASSTSACFTAVPAPKNGSNPWTGFDTSYVLGTVSTSAGTGTLQIYDSTSITPLVPYPVTLTEQAVPSGVNPTYLGGWLLTTGPATAASLAGGQVSGSSAFLILESNGSFVTSSSGSATVTGNFNLSTGIGSATISNANNVPPTICGGMPGGGVFGSSSESWAIDLTNGTFTRTYVSGTLPGFAPGTLFGTGTFTRVATGAAELLTQWGDNEGKLSDVAAETQITMALNAQINWPANPPLSGNATHGINIAVAMTGDPNIGSSCQAPTGTPTKLEAYAIKPEISPVGFGGGSGNSSDTISFGYIKGQAQQYAVSVVSSPYCTVTSGGSGAVNDANANNPSAYPTIVVTCTQ